ncbi:heparin lyase I family protein [Pelomonas sp. KK5]|uniref:heparin lyase I family protein n=1 Tax=Pelomonas sp. KK5 TaxID=1855730 RepID=UPI0009FAADBB|nr:heparin lyase I family protein [Pelomonas sp. KK5]
MNTPPPMRHARFSLLLLGAVLFNACGQGSGKEPQIPLAAVTVAVPPAGTVLPASPVDMRDITIDVNAEVPLERQQWYFECHGVSRHASSLASQVLPANADVPYATQQRMAVVTPPGNPLRGIVLRTAQGDPMTSGAPRCEFTFTANARSFLPEASDFWQAQKIWVEDWSQAGDMQLVYQWHDTDFPLALNPLMALVVQGGTAFLQVRWETSGKPTTGKSTIATKDIWIGPANTFTGRWATIVVQARISPDPARQPFLKFWIDGRLLADYSGPLGYIQPGKPVYGKLGFYHWLQGNMWDPRYPIRSIYVRRAVTVLDPNRRYDEPMLNSLVQ